METRLTTDEKCSRIQEIAHDLRSPLTVVLGFSEILVDTSADPVTRSRLEAIRSAAQVLRSLAEDLNALTTTGTPVGAAHQQVDIQRLLASVVDGVACHPATTRGPLHVDSPSEPMVWTTDPDRLARVLLNLLDNAVVHAPGASVTLRAIPGDRWMRFEVEDAGPGIPADDRERIFERSVQLEPDGPGQGLGLASARRLVQSLGGSLSVRSRVGLGTTFVVDLPR